jgi:hypothetical protein
MGLLSDLELPKRKWPCAVRSVSNSLEAEDKEILLAAVMNPEWQYSSLERALAEKGVTLSQNTIKRHRLKGCSCWKI